MEGLPPAAERKEEEDMKVASRFSQTSLGIRRERRKNWQRW